LEPGLSPVPDGSDPDGYPTRPTTRQTSRSCPELLRGQSLVSALCAPTATRNQPDTTRQRPIGAAECERLLAQDAEPPPPPGRSTAKSACHLCCVRSALPLPQ